MCLIGFTKRIPSVVVKMVEWDWACNCSERMYSHMGVSHCGKSRRGAGEHVHDQVALMAMDSGETGEIFSVILLRS